MTKFDIIITNKKPITPTYKVEYYNVRNNAWRFLLLNDIKSYPLNLRQIAINNNWEIWSYNKYCQATQSSIIELIKQHPDGFSTVIDGFHVICYNEKNNRQRNRFTICHEIGHIINEKRFKGKRLEQEANMFAARILMPMLLIKDLNIKKPEELAKLCDVSVEAATYRLKRFKIVSERNKFYTNPLEQEVFTKLQPFLKDAKEKINGKL